MDGLQMASGSKKRGSVESKLGRPKNGALSTYPKELVSKIKQLRGKNEGWGAISLLLELEEEFGYSKSSLPSIDSVNRFLKQEGFIKAYEPAGELPLVPCPKPKQVHELWEMDAQGAIQVSDIGYQSLINIKDSRSKKHCIAFPVAVNNQSSQPRALHYQWALRLAFCESGLPKVVQGDRDSVFIENNSKSPYPSRIHLWLLALGVDLCFIKVPPPQKQAMVERSHQTMERQAIKGQQYNCWKHFFQNCTKRRKRLNEKFPNRSLGKKSPLQAFPEAVHSGRDYSLEKEYEQFDLNNIYRFLSKAKWYRIVSSRKMISLGGRRYYLKNAIPKSQIQITFCFKTKQLIFRDFKELQIAQLPIKGITKKDLMGTDPKKLVAISKKLQRVRDFSLG